MAQLRRHRGDAPLDCGEKLLNARFYASQYLRVLENYQAKVVVTAGIPDFGKCA